MSRARRCKRPDAGWGTHGWLRRPTDAGWGTHRWSLCCSRHQQLRCRQFPYQQFPCPELRERLTSRLVTRPSQRARQRGPVNGMVLALRSNAVRPDALADMVIRNTLGPFPCTADGPQPPFRRRRPGAVRPTVGTLIRQNTRDGRCHKECLSMCPCRLWQRESLPASRSGGLALLPRSLEGPHKHYHAR